jgi:two-component system response regulator YesN
MLAMDKIKVVLVDDEYLEINLLKKCIDWESMNMEIVGEALDATSGLALIDELSPKILFTDIQMPMIDGIQFSKMALEKHPDIKIVILTGFDDFYYAQESIKIRVSDFLLKPIDDDELLKTLSKLKDIIDQEKKSLDETRGLKKQFRSNLPYLKKNLLLTLLSGDFDTEALQNEMPFLGIEFQYSSFQIASVEVSKPQYSDGHLNGEFIFIHDAEIIKILNASLGENQCVFIFNDAFNRIVILNNDENVNLCSECEKFKTQLLVKSEYCVNIGLGEIQNGIEGVSISYKESLEALKYRVVVGNNRVIPYNRLGDFDTGNVFDVSNLNEKMMGFLKSGDESCAIDELELYFQTIDLKDANALKYIRATAMDVISVCLSILVDLGIDTNHIYQSEIQSYNEVFMLDTLPDIKHHLSGIVSKTVHAVSHQKLSKTNNLVLEIKHYLDAYLSDSSLSLTTVAKKYYMNPSYLSRMFKKEVGVNFVVYLTKIRMKKALDLIRVMDLKAFEIADLVGITDSNYFCTCFKKYTSLSVSDYKKLLDCGQDLYARRKVE